MMEATMMMMMMLLLSSMSLSSQPLEPLRRKVHVEIDHQS